MHTPYQKMSFRYSLISKKLQEGCNPDAIMDKPHLCSTQSCQTSPKTLRKIRRRNTSHFNITEQM